MLIVYGFLLLMIFLWGFSFIIVDIAVEYMPPLSIALYRFIIASICFLCMDFYLKVIKKEETGAFKPNHENNFVKRDWFFIIIASFTGVSFFFFAQYNAINLIGPSLPALFVCLLSPVIISLLALLFFNEKLNTLKLTGFLIATLGGFLLVTGGDLSNLTPNSPDFLGYLLALLTPVLWAIYSTITKKINTLSSIDMLKYICYLGTLELGLFLIFTGEIVIFIQNFLNLALFLCALYLGLGCYVIGYFIWQSSQKKMDSSKVASFLYVEPFLTLLFSFLLQREETIVIWNVIGGIIVLFAVLIINYEKKELN